VYDIFKEAKIRRFIGRFPDSRCRPLLLKRLYPYLAMSPAQSAQFARRFFDTSADPEDPFYSHRPRWKTTGSIMALTDPDFFSEAPPPEEGLLEEIGGALKGLGPFARAQYLEMTILLSNYLLSSQGDRMAMAHSVEGRFPFLDHRVVEFAGSLPPGLKMKVLDEKYLLKRAFREILPERIVKRKKQPYMAPDILSFFGETSPEYLDHYLSESQISECGVFRPSAVAALVRKCRKGGRQGFRENMAFVSILSTQIIYDRFISDFYIKTPDELPGTKRVSREHGAGQGGSH
jgi:asparagine synthase (glutamine-hydrolysing)